MDKPYVAGIDIGGQTSKLGIVDARGTVLAQTSIRTDSHKDVNLFIAELCDALEKLAEKTGGISKVRGIGIGAPNGSKSKSNQLPSTGPQKLEFKMVHKQKRFCKMA